jgi:hypothetical protein
MMTSDYMFKNADFSIELAQAVPVEHSPESWTLTNAATASGGLGVSRVIDDNNTWGLFFKQTASPIATMAMQAWTCPQYAPVTQEVAFCIMVQTRVNSADVSDPDKFMSIRMQRLNTGASLYQRQYYKVSANMGTDTILRLVFTAIPGSINDMSFGVPALADGGKQCNFIVKKAWLEIVKPQ